MCDSSGAVTAATPLSAHGQRGRRGGHSERAVLTSTAMLCSPQQSSRMCTKPLSTDAIPNDGSPGGLQDQPQKGSWAKFKRSASSSVRRTYSDQPIL